MLRGSLVKVWFDLFLCPPGGEESYRDVEKKRILPIRKEAAPNMGDHVKSGDKE